MTEQRSAVVTGAGRGIGRAILERLLQDRWIVVGVELDPAWAAEAEEAIHGGGVVMVGDVASRDALAGAAARACALAPLRAWVNCAAESSQTALHHLEPDRLERILAVNVRGTIWGAAAAVDAFIAQRSGGAIVNVSSIHGRFGFAGWAAYETSKGGVEAFTRYLAVEYGPLGIRANAVAPGTIQGTPSHERHVESADDPEALRRSLAEIAPLRRLGVPADVAEAVAYLVSPRASYITGQVIGVDGGLSAACAPSVADPELIRRYENTS